MKLSQLVDQLHEKHPELSRRQVDRSVKTIIDAMARALTKDHRVEIRDFGIFMLSKRKSRELRNPRTGEKVFIAERAVPRFKAGKRLRERLNSRDADSA